MPVSGEERVPRRRRAVASLAAAAMVLLALVCLALISGGVPAKAATYGQIGEAWGSVGTGKGQLKEPTVYGVDPVDGSVYIGDTVSAATSPSPVYRLQKFSSEGTLEASTELSGLLESGIKTTFRGVAVDHAAGLVYLLEQCTVGTASTSGCKASGMQFALALRVFKIMPSNGELVPAATPRVLLPTSTEDQIRKPISIAIDPVSHGVVILGKSFAEHPIIERIGPTGNVEARFEDEHLLQPIGSPGPGGIVIGPTGIVYTLVGGRLSPGAKGTRLWELPQNLESVSQVPGFAQAAESEEWLAGADLGTSQYAPELALAPDGDSIYWKEGDSEEVGVRDFSLTTNSTTAVLGGGKARCKINSTAAALGVWGEGSAERLLVLDLGTTERARNQVITFGQGGSGCPTPVAKFKINGSEADGTTVHANQPVEFNAGPSELLDGEPEKVVWNFGDGSEPKVLECERLEAGGGCEHPASLKTTHEYETNGEYTVTLEIELEAATFGNPVPVSHTLKVEGGAPPPPQPISVLRSGTGTGTVTSAPAGIDCGSNCSAPFEIGQTVVLTATPAAGSTFAGWTEGSCSGTGTCTLEGGTERTVTARFESEGPPPSEFELSASTSGPGTVTSSPAGIDCGAQCGALFASGATVTLTATPTGAAKFGGWSGACTGSETTCQVTMDETRSVRATFIAPVVGQILLVAVTGEGAGAVKSARPGINCGVYCEDSYKTGTLVSLFPEAMPGSEFVAWGGSCAGAGLVCELKMSGGRSVTATFARKQTVTVSSPAAAPAAAPAPPAPTPVAKRKKKKKKPAKASSKALKKKLAKCKKLKPAARDKCVRKARRKSHHKPHS